MTSLASRQKSEYVSQTHTRNQTITATTFTTLVSDDTIQLSISGFLEMSADRDFSVGEEIGQGGVGSLFTGTMKTKTGSQTCVIKKFNFQSRVGALGTLGIWSSGRQVDHCWRTFHTTLV